MIHNGRFEKQPIAVSPEITAIGGNSFNALMDVSMESVLLRAYFAVRSHGYNFHLVEIPPEADIGNNMLGCEKKHLLAGFDSGYALGKQADPWREFPPTFGDFPPWALEILKDIQ